MILLYYMIIVIKINLTDFFESIENKNDNNNKITKSKKMEKFEIY